MNVALHSWQSTARRSLLEPRDWVVAQPVSGWSVHQRTVQTVLVETLASVFTATVAAVGADFFRYAAARFAATRPPRSAVLDAYGESFAAFLRTFAATRQQRFVCELARLEWLVHRVRLEGVTQGITPDELLAIEPSRWPDARLHWVRGVRYADFEFAIDTTRRILLDEGVAGCPAPERRRVFLQVRSSLGGAVVERLTADQYWFRSRLHLGASILQAARGLEERGLDVGASVFALVESSLVARIDSPAPSI
jgi:hypothetical protein